MQTLYESFYLKHGHFFSRLIDLLEKFGISATEQYSTEKLAKNVLSSSMQGQEPYTDQQVEENIKEIEKLFTFFVDDYIRQTFTSANLTLPKMVFCTEEQEKEVREQHSAPKDWLGLYHAPSDDPATGCVFIRRSIFKDERFRNNPAKILFTMLMAIMHEYRHALQHHIVANAKYDFINFDKQFDEIYKTIPTLAPVVKSAIKNDVSHFNPNDYIILAPVIINKFPWLFGEKEINAFLDDEKRNKLAYYGDFREGDARIAERMFASSFMQEYFEKLTLLKDCCESDHFSDEAKRQYNIMKNAQAYFLYSNKSKENELKFSLENMMINQLFVKGLENISAQDFVDTYLDESAKAYFLSPNPDPRKIPFSFATLFSSKGLLHYLDKDGSLDKAVCAKLTSNLFTEDEGASIQ